MARVTDDDVKAIINTTRDTTPFIETANIIVSEELVGKGLSENRLKQIELYLSAHFVAITEENGALVRKKMGDADESYQLEKGKGFAMTRYGQQAIDLDTTGIIKNISQTEFTARFTVV